MFDASLLKLYTHIESSIQRYGKELNNLTGWVVSIFVKDNREFMFYYNQ